MSKKYGSSDSEALLGCIGLFLVLGVLVSISSALVIFALNGLFALGLAYSVKNILLMSFNGGNMYSNSK